MAHTISKDRLERACRIYADTKSAAQAVGMSAGGFARKCRQLGIETPSKRKIRRNKKCQSER